MLADTTVQLAAVCLPPFVHAPATVDLLDAGVNVLLEKPMAPTLAECDAILAAAGRSGQLLSVVAQNRYKTPMMKLKQVLDSGMIGRILHAQVDSFWWRGSRYYDLWWRGTWAKEGGGCTMNHAVHHIDLFQWMMGMPDEVQAVVTNLNHEQLGGGGFLDNGGALWRWPPGAGDRLPGPSRRGAATVGAGGARQRGRALAGACVPTAGQWFPRPRSGDRRGD